MTTKLLPLEGCDRCYCGAKYWDGDVCVSCGEKWRPVVMGVNGPVGILDAVRAAADRFGGEVRDERGGLAAYLVTFNDTDDALDFMSELRESGYDVDEVVL